MTRLLAFPTPGLWHIALLCLALPVATAAERGEPFDPAGIVLTWQRDPATTMTIDWHSIDGVGIELVEKLSPGHKLPVTVPRPAAPRESKLEFRRAGEAAWSARTGRAFPFPVKEDREGSLHRDGYSHSFEASERTIHRLELTSLRPDTLYELRFDPAGTIYRFRTMPAALTREIRIAAGGDIGYGTWAERMHHLAASYDPDFALWGGDLAYCDGAPQRLGRWYDFFYSKKRALLTKERRLIPVLVTSGNHEVQGGYSDRIERATEQPYKQDDEGRRRAAPYFMSFFAMPGDPGYNVLDFGNYLSVVMLDSGHLNPISGRQAAWLDETLTRRAAVPHVLPAYHIPGFPSFRPLTDRYVAGVREHWVPIFEKHRLPVVLENHDHNYKRTFPVRDGRRDPPGVTYLGDGSWGAFVVGVRAAEERWYLEKAQAVNHFILIRLNGPDASYEAINLKGEVIDRYSARRR
jgi:acid phosphatase type 7